MPSKIIYSLLISVHLFTRNANMDSLKVTMLNNYQVSFQVADALNQPFPDGQFDLVWSMESGEHMPDKTKVLSIPLRSL